MMDQRELAKELLEKLKNLKEGDIKKNLKLQKKLEKISKLKDDIINSNDVKNIVKMTKNSDLLIKANYFIINNGRESYDADIMSTPKDRVMKVFMKYQDTFTDEEYWRELRYVYTLQDFMELPYEIYKALFNSKRSKKELLMDEEERVFLEQLPDKLTIYRGGASKESETGYGVSWTLNKSIAQQFVDRKKYLVKDEMVVHQLEIPKSKVVAYFNSRQEQEIIYF
jgi:hypothetical protein